VVQQDIISAFGGFVNPRTASGGDLPAGWLRRDRGIRKTIAASKKEIRAASISPDLCRYLFAAGITGRSFADRRSGSLLTLMMPHRKGIHQDIPAWMLEYFG
jgi:hypothetical protein